jgi:hypothetical protein
VRLPDTTLPNGHTLRFEVWFKVAQYGMMQLNIDTQNKRMVVAEQAAAAAQTMPPPQQQQQQQQQYLGPPPASPAPLPTLPDEWRYLDPQGAVQGPYTLEQVRNTESLFLF